MFLLYFFESYFIVFNQVVIDLTPLLRSSYLSCLLSYQGGNVLSEYAGAVVCRGVACANRTPAAARWRPLHRPAYLDVVAQSESTWASLSAAFFDPSGIEPLHTSVGM